MAKPAYKPGGVVKTVRGPDGKVYHAPYGFTAQQVEQIKAGVKGLPATMYPYPGFVKSGDAKSPAEQQRLTEGKLTIPQRPAGTPLGTPYATHPYDSPYVPPGTGSSAGGQTQTQPYNPNAYVPGGLSPDVSKMIQDAGYGNVPFDWSKYIGTDPILAGTLTQIQQAQIQGGSNLVGGAQQIYGRLGEMPTNLSPELAALLGPEQRAALEGAISEGNKAGTTGLARLNFDYRLGQSQATNRVAGLGALRSGAYGQEANKGLRALTLGQYDARQTALDTLQGLQSTYLQGQDTARAGIGTALTAAQQRAADLVNAGQLGGAYKPPASTNPYMTPTAAPTMGMPQITRGSNAGPSAAAIFGGGGYHLNSAPGPSGPSASLTPKPSKPPAAPGLKTRFY